MNIKTGISKLFSLIRLTKGPKMSALASLLREVKKIDNNIKIFSFLI
tara:strand:+ start:1122 stop:1262 length:141 start_codon:yes stop_codon:yes gene_type:complete